MAYERIITHKPKLLPVKIDMGMIASELSDAAYALGLLQGAQEKLKNPLLLMAPLSTKEAVVSSKIEGTQSTVSDVYVYEAGGETKYKDVAQVFNYRAAAIYAIEEIQQGKKLNQALVRRLHQMLLNDVRHKGEVGVFRSKQVWIAAREGEPIQKALYIPPEHVHIQEYMENLFKYLQSEEHFLIKAGMMHYQFEAVHPFEDGNGRIGRLLIPILLYSIGKLSLPTLYLSGYLEDNKDAYITALRGVDREEKYENWLKFYLVAVKEQALETQKIINRILSLTSGLQEKYEGTRSPNLHKIVEYLFLSPVITIPKIQKKLKVSYLTANTLVKKLENDKVLIKLGRKEGKAPLYAYEPLLRI